MKDYKDFKGTKGAWEHEGDNSWECSIITDNEKQTISLENTDSESDDGFYEMVGNAKLIAAAPDLLENLTRILDRIKECEYQDSFPSAFKRAEQAINKALSL